MQTFCDNGDFFLLFLSDASLYDGIVWPIIIYHESFNLISKSPTREGGDNIIPVKQIMLGRKITSYYHTKKF